MNLNVDWPNFHRDFPVTFGLGVLNLGLFLLAKVGLLAPLVSIPGILNIGTFGAHFFHMELWHLGSNLILLLLVGRILEPHLRSGLWPVTVSIWLGTVLILWLFNPSPVLGFSGIAMGLLSFALMLYWKNPHLYSLLWPLVVINIVFGLMPGISWWGHLGGAVAGFATFALWRIAHLKS